jgi:hypothetical protein
VNAPEDASGEPLDVTRHAIGGVFHHSGFFGNCNYIIGAKHEEVRILVRRRNRRRRRQDERRSAARAPGWRKCRAPSCRCLPASPSRRKSAISTSRTTTACRRKSTRRSIKALEDARKAMGQKLGDAANPLLVSVRSGAKFSMPGMMNTILNLGLNDETVKAWKPRAAIRASPTIATAASSRCSAKWRSDRHGEVRPHLRRPQEEGQGQARYRPDRRGSEGHHRRLQEAGAEEDRQAVPAGRHASSSPGSRDAVFRSWWNPAPSTTARWKRFPTTIGTAVNVQAMVFGNMGETSATGVGFTRNPATGEKSVLRRVPG